MGFNKEKILQMKNQAVKKIKEKTRYRSPEDVLMENFRALEKECMKNKNDVDTCLKLIEELQERVQDLEKEPEELTTIFQEIDAQEARA